eukprot:3374473-Pyramimonas_sp.AAC.1
MLLRALTLSAAADHKKDGPHNFSPPSRSLSFSLAISFPLLRDGKGERRGNEKVTREVIIMRA